MAMLNSYFDITRGYHWSAKIHFSYFGLVSEKFLNRGRDLRRLTHLRLLGKELFLPYDQCCAALVLTISSL